MTLVKAEFPISWSSFSCAKFEQVHLTKLRTIRLIKLVEPCHYDMIQFNWYHMPGSGLNWHNSIGIRYLELVEYDTIQLITNIWNLANMAHFNWHQMSRTDKYDTVQYLELIKFNCYAMQGTCLIWHHSIDNNNLQLSKCGPLWFLSKGWIGYNRYC